MKLSKKFEPNKKKFVVVSGLSGAGKSQVLNILEDDEYFCVDNLPVALIHKFIALLKHSKRDKFAIGIDIRTVDSVKDLVKVVDILSKEKLGFKIIKLFLDANDETLIKRFSETRRRHPLGGNLISSIAKERKLLNHIKKESDFVINTSETTLSELKNKILEVIETKPSGKLNITILSFAYKFGLPLNADFVFDVRFLPNPNYVESLKKFTGKDKNVERYILSSEVTQKFLNILKQFIEFVLPKICSEGKNYLTIAFGCTGGQHRSVVIAETIYKHLITQKKIFKIKYDVTIQHSGLSKTIGL